MRRKFFPRWTKVQVTWHDAYSSEENDLEYYEKYKPCVRVSYGVVVCDGPDRIAIAATDDRLSLAGTDIEDTTVIPASFLVDVQELTIKKSK